MVDLQGTFGFVVGNLLLGTTIVIGRGNVPGAPVIMSSTRAKLCGIFAAVTYVRLVQEYCHGITPRKGLGYTLYCNSKEALSRMTNSYFDEFGTIWRCRANYDLEVAIHQCLKRFRFQWIGSGCVAGHAIKRKRREKFTCGEALNDTSDHLATEAREYSTTDDHDHWPEQEVSVIGLRGRMCGRLKPVRTYCFVVIDQIPS
jgi:hypothetical protein